MSHQKMKVSGRDHPGGKRLSKHFENPHTLNPKLRNIQTSKIVESTLIENYNFHQTQCLKCKQLIQKVRKLSIISQYVKLMREQNQQYKEQIQFLTENFKYIIQLANKNISQGVKTRVKKIFHQKQILLEKKQKVIKRLQNQVQTFMSKLDQDNDLKVKIESLQIKIKQLQKQNSILKSLTNNGKQFQNHNSESNKKDSTKDEQFDVKGKQFPTLTCQNSERKINLQKDSKPSLSIRKLKTLNIDHSTHQNSKNSLSDLRQKINRIKYQIINQNC